MEEELIFANSLSRLDYFKTGIEWENRLRVKKQQLSNGITINKKQLKETQQKANGTNEKEAESKTEEGTGGGGKKRVKVESGKKNWEDDTINEEERGEENTDAATDFPKNERSRRSGKRQKS